MRLSGSALFICFLILGITACKDKSREIPLKEIDNVNEIPLMEDYRPQFHFTPKEKWMNDPNGLVYNKGIYHLFYQYYPEDIVWGPMHWGHAISKDMVFWEHRPIALYPDEKGLIFSGSAVVDKENTSGFGTPENPPLVAIFTYHNMEGEKSGELDFQTQGIAYSLDNGENWEKYNGNPVIDNPGIKDFRDPKVFWHQASERWIMVLVAGDRAQFYNSKDLKSWEFMSEFGKEHGAHGGVWECPDLFPLKVDGDGAEKWVLIISINPGAPNGGSGTQYFIGDFDGTTFTTSQQDAKWIDWGTDNYAGVTYNEVPDDTRLFIGWMSNWSYARDTPTKQWRSAMTLPRTLTLRSFGDEILLANYPIDGLDAILRKEEARNLSIPAMGTDSIQYNHLNQGEVRFTTEAKNFNLSFSNDKNEKVILTLDGTEKIFTLDRTKSGKTDFQADFGSIVQKMPVQDLPEQENEFRILIDWSSIEIFINKGQYVMTAQIFPNENFNELKMVNSSDSVMTINNLEVSKAESVWR
ncbi:glycoside hydrolase family 32 protein [Muriicola sp. Z0-33]|uniref:glycoside hydrolase family 32 protein n=1 Tax=Muriicola sp. Z0-33 TaxID=2816957 RepID=UPI002236FF69|nr:glycoside hydrolase family 32 protein [Muriicola sp. Z0-33]MCW5515122.1 glycoside hydrolase family 32 protein [Muriicola sp. Z0-33]